MSRAGRMVRRLGVGALGALVLVAGAGIPVYVLPAIDPVPEHADAVLVLGPPTRARTELGRDLVEAGVADTLVISVWASDLSAPAGENDVVACDEPDMEVICFTAEPGTTQGEARELAADARIDGWDSVVVITQTPHIARARLLLGRCFDGELAMVSSGEPYTLGDWAYEYAYQTGAFVKALADPGC